MNSRCERRPTQQTQTQHRHRPGDHPIGGPRRSRSARAARRRDLRHQLLPAGLAARSAGAAVSPAGTKSKASTRAGMSLPSMPTVRQPKARNLSISGSARSTPASGRRGAAHCSCQQPASSEARKANSTVTSSTEACRPKGMLRTIASSISGDVPCRGCRRSPAPGVRASTVIPVGPSSRAGHRDGAGQPPACRSNRVRGATPGNTQRVVELRRELLFTLKWSGTAMIPG